jgi:hypothetical protein
MKRRIARAAGCGWFVLGLVSFVAVPARAQIVNEENVGRLTIGGGVGFLLPAMGQVNDNIDVLNPFLAREEVRGLDHIKEALLTQLDVRYRLGNTPKTEPGEKATLLDRLSVGLSWGAINAHSQLEVSRVDVRYYSRATTYSLYVLYHLPFLDAKFPRTQLVVGGGPLLLRNSSVEWVVLDHTSNNFFTEIEDGVGDLSELSGRGEAEGSGVGANLQGGGTFMLNRRFSVGLDFGYRLGKISNLELNEATGQSDLRFPNPDEVPVERQPGDWGIIDFFYRDPNTTYEGRNRNDPPDRDPETGGCAGCPLYYRGGPLEIDYSGLFANLTLRAHF